MHGCYSNKLNTTGEIYLNMTFLGCVWGGAGGGSDHLYRLLENCVFILSNCISKATIVLSCSVMKRQYGHLPCYHDNNKVTPEDECQKLEFSAVLRLNSRKFCRQFCYENV